MNSERVGVIVGRGKEQDHLEMVVSFSEREKAPKLGSFLIVEEQEFMKRKFLSRVEDMNYGDFQATKDERIRAIVEKYMREIGGYARELSEEEKRTLFFRHYALKVLGQFSSDGKKIVTEYRLLPELSSVCRSPTDGEYAIITSAGIQDTKKALKVGKLVIGDEVRANDILFEPWKFEKRRTAIFARTGYGKSNLCKVVVSLASLIGDSGILVLDMDGEYAFKTQTVTGQEVLGLADLEHVKPNLVVYTQRIDVFDVYKDVYISPILNLAFIGPSLVAELCTDQNLKILPEFKYSGSQEWQQFLSQYRNENNTREQRDKHLLDFCGGVTKKVNKKGEEKIDISQQYALRRNLREVLEWDEPKACNIVEDIKFHLARKRLVIVDLSLMTLEMAHRVAHLVLDAVFDYNVKGITAGKTINTIAVFEEAQNVLNRKAVEEAKSVFTRWAKEGRKFQLGLIYVTQQPGAIAEEIVSQTDNYFVMHLLNKGDIDALKRANPHYDGVTADFLSMETFVGNTYIYSAPLQPYVFPAKVFEFNKDFFDAFSNEIKHSKSALVELQDMAERLKPIAGKKYGEKRKLVGACSYEIYKYLKGNNVSAPFMDDEKQWIDYEMAEYLVKELERQNLLKLPTFFGQSALEGAEPDDNA
jgi:hypothetical protein